MVSLAVAHVDVRAAVVDFLHDDFGNDFQIDLFAFDRLLRCRGARHGMSDEEIIFPMPSNASLRNLESSPV